MKIYVDNDFKCHVNNDGTMREFEEPLFDNKCKEYIEGHRFIPEHEFWIDENGRTFFGSQIFAYINYDILEKFQSQYEQSQSELNSILTQIETALEVPDDN